MYDCGLITAVSGIACAIIKCSSDDELSLMSAVLTQLGDTLATYLTQKDICENRKSKEKTSESNTNEDNNPNNTNESEPDVITNF